MSDYIKEIWAGTVTLFLMGIYGVMWWVRRQIHRMDNHDERLRQIENDYARRSDIDNVIKVVRDSERSTAKRIDRVYEALEKRHTHGE